MLRGHGILNAGLPPRRYGLAAALLVSAAGCGAAATTPTGTKAKQAISHQNAENGPPSLTVTDQSSSGYWIRVAALKATDGPKAESSGSDHAGGYVAIASDVKDKPSVVLGYTAVKEGTDQNVMVRADSKLASGRYFVLLEPVGSKSSSVSAFVLFKEIAVTVS